MMWWCRVKSKIDSGALMVSWRHHSKEKFLLLSFRTTFRCWCGCWLLFGCRSNLLIATLFLLLHFRCAEDILLLQHTLIHPLLLSDNNILFLHCTTLNIAFFRRGHNATKQIHTRSLKDICYESPAILQKYYCIVSFFNSTTPSVTAADGAAADAFVKWPRPALTCVQQSSFAILPFDI